MGSRMMNLDLAAGWLRYAGMKKVHPYHLDGEESIGVHESCCSWAAQAAHDFDPESGLKIVDGECWLGNGTFAGRFLAVKISTVWAGGGFAVAISAHTPGGDRRAGLAFLHTHWQVKKLAEDIGRAMTLPSPAKLDSIRASVKKWEGRNPVGFVNDFIPLPSMPMRLALGFFGILHKIKHRTLPSG